MAGILPDQTAKTAAFRLGLEGCIVDRSQDISWQCIRKDIAPFAVTWTHIPSRSVIL